MMGIDLVPNSTIYGDKAYNDYKFEDLLLDICCIRLIPERKANSKRQHSGCMRYLQRKLRKRIETTFSEIITSFSTKNRCSDGKGIFNEIADLYVFVCFAEALITGSETACLKSWIWP